MSKKAAEKDESHPEVGWLGGRLPDLVWGMRGMGETPSGFCHQRDHIRGREEGHPPLSLFRSSSVGELSGSLGLVVQNTEQCFNSDRVEKI
jgi:hypothetical protein